MYTEVLKFVPEYCSLLLGVWQEHGTPPTGSGFDFIVNAVWPEIVAVIDEKAAVIFAPGNPDTFHKVYCKILSVYNSKECCFQWFLSWFLHEQNEDSLLPTSK